MAGNGRNQRSKDRLITAAMGLITLAVLLGVRHALAGKLLPDGQWLEGLCRKVEEGAEPVAEAVISAVQAWLRDG